MAHGKKGNIDNRKITDDPLTRAVGVEGMTCYQKKSIKAPLYLKGKPYRFNWNLFGIDPDGIKFSDGIKFKVTTKASPEVCAGL